MKKIFLLTMALTSTPSFATGIGSIPHGEEHDADFSIDGGYYYHISGWEGQNNPLAEDAMSNVVRDAPYIRLNYQFQPDWYISGIYGYENISNDPKNQFMEIDEDLSESFFGVQLKGKLYEYEDIDLGAYIQYTTHADYTFDGEFQTDPLILNQYDVSVKNLEDLLVGLMLQKEYGAYDVYGGLFYQDSNADISGNLDVSGSTSSTSIGGELEVDSNAGGMLGVNIHTNSQWDVNLEYQNRGDHGIDIAATYHFKKPEPKVITRIVEVPVLQSPKIGPTFYDGMIYFNEGSAEINANQRANVRKLARFMEDNPKAKARIEGHCDCTGPESYNMNLSKDRAKVVKNFIIEYYGIEENRVQMIGYGESLPAATNDTAEGRSQNRRVRIYATK